MQIPVRIEKLLDGTYQGSIEVGTVGGGVLQDNDHLSFGILLAKDSAVLPGESAFLDLNVIVRSAADAQVLVKDIDVLASFGQTVELGPCLALIVLIHFTSSFNRLLVSLFLDYRLVLVNV